MIVKTKRGYYVYDAINAIGRRRRLGGPFTTYKQATRLNEKTKVKRRKRRKK